ncbi:hypothetical protein FACS1894218_0810 [Bacilli bacterium]|nr:hypothetical protein FACS1894218_0810 [Bacilli bacterium]
MKKFKVDIVVTKTYEFSKIVEAVDNVDAAEQTLKASKSIT